MQYVIVFDKPIRIGLNVTESIGPFDTIENAKLWIAGEFAIPLPPATIISLLKAEA